MFLLAVTLETPLPGDGRYYFAMVAAIASSGSPEITDLARAAFRQHLGYDFFGALLVKASDGSIYAFHFWFYSLLCVPAYALLSVIGANALKCFQLTNAAICTLALFYILLVSRLPSMTRALAASGFLLSTAVIYFQWSHPEVYSAALILVASLAFIERRTALAVFLASVSSLQNPSSVLLIIPFLFEMAVNLVKDFRQGKPWPDALAELARAAAPASIALIPYAWSYVRLGVLNTIAISPAIDFSNISVARFVSFIFDLNQGLIVGLPLLLWSIPFVFFIRVMERIRDRNQLLRREDLLILGFILMTVPTLAQDNWNSGHNIFVRYASWSGMALVVWVAVTITPYATALRSLIVVPALALQGAMLLYLAPLTSYRTPSYIQFMPWVMPIWKVFPHHYNPDPEIFAERASEREMYPLLAPVVLRSPTGYIIRVLTKQKSKATLADEVCGPGNVLEPVDRRPSSKLRLHPVRRGFSYATGRLVCRASLPATLTMKDGGSQVPMRIAGWARPGAWGTWSVDSYAELHIPLQKTQAARLRVRMIGSSFVNESNQEQIFDVAVGGRVIDTWVARHPQSEIDETIEFGQELLNHDRTLKLAFHIKTPLSLAKLGVGGDARKIGLIISELRIEALHEPD